MGSRHSSTILKTVLKSAFLLTLTGTAVLGSQNADVKVNAKSDSSLSSELNPVPASYGYFVDHYQENVKTNSTPDTNPAIALFNNTFLTYWNPTTSTKTNASLLQENLDKSIQISNGASQAEIDSFIFNGPSRPSI